MSVFALPGLDPGIDLADPVTTWAVFENVIQAGGYWMPRVKQLEAGHDRLSIHLFSAVS
jgi:hypothetical protein